MRYVKEAFRLLKQTHITVDSEDVDLFYADESGEEEVGGGGGDGGDGGAPPADAGGSADQGGGVGQAAAADGEPAGAAAAGDVEPAAAAAAAGAGAVAAAGGAAAGKPEKKKIKLTYAKYEEISRLLVLRLRQDLATLQVSSSSPSLCSRFQPSRSLSPASLPRAHTAPRCAERDEAA